MDGLRTFVGRAQSGFEDAQGYVSARHVVVAESCGGDDRTGSPHIIFLVSFSMIHTYVGPDADSKLALARSLCPEGFTPFAEWALENMKP